MSSFQKLAGMMGAIALLTCWSARATSWVWLSAEVYLESSQLIAVLEVGEVHEAYTPEGILVRSALAKVERVLHSPWKELLDQSVVIYDVDPNAWRFEGHVFSNSHWTIEKGRYFAILEMRGDNKYRPYDRLSLQKIPENGLVYWPGVKPTTERLTVDGVADRIREILRVNPDLGK